MTCLQLLPQANKKPLLNPAEAALRGNVSRLQRSPTPLVVTLTGGRPVLCVSGYPLTTPATDAVGACMTTALTSRRQGLVRHEAAVLFSICRLFVVRLVAPSLTASEPTHTPDLALLDERRFQGQPHCPLALLARGWAERSVATA